MEADEDEAEKIVYQSRIFASIHKSASDLHRLGLIDDETMRKFDASCLTQEGRDTR